MKPIIAEKLKDALIKKYEAEIADAEARLYIYFTNSVGIGEHPQHFEEMDNFVEKLTNASDKLIALKEFYSRHYGN
jgi:hypothetical protein